jgi:hypothetical protein
MKLYIESYQSKVEELEPMEESYRDMESQVDNLKKQNFDYNSRIGKYF